MISDYFASLTRQLEGITDCTVLTDVSTAALANVTQMQNDVTATLSAIAPLLTAPTDLASVITWITHMITQFSGPNATLLAQQTALATERAAYVSAVAARRSELGC